MYGIFKEEAGRWYGWNMVRDRGGAKDEGPQSFPQMVGKPLGGLEQRSDVICLGLKRISLATY